MPARRPENGRRIRHEAAGELSVQRSPLLIPSGIFGFEPARIRKMTALVVTIALIVASTYLAGRMAEVRGRSVRVWQWLAALLIGPMALPLLYVLAARRSHAG